MATNDTQQIIQQQRQQIETAKKQAQEIAKREKYTKKQLLQSGLAARARRKSLAARKRKAVQQQMAQISAQEKTFETDVAQKAPTYAQPKYKEQAYQVAKKSYETKISSLQKRIESKRASAQRASEQGRDDREDRERDDIRELTAELNVYKGALTGGKEAAITSHYSGQTRSLADYKRDVEEARTQRSEQKKSFAQQQGFTSYSQYQKAYKEQELTAVTLPSITSQAKIQQALGTYDPKTGIYINKEGGGYSMAQEFVPSGTKIIGQELQQASSFDLSKALQKFQTPAQQKISEKFIKPKVQQIQLETKRYQDLGYSSSQASKLALASLASGGVTFTSEYAKQIIKPSFKERVKDVVDFTGRTIEDVREFHREIPPPSIVDTRRRYDPRTGMYLEPTYGIGVGGTAIMTPPTPEEQFEIEEAQRRGSYEEVLEKPILIPVGEKVAEMEIWEKEVKVPIFIGAGGGIPIGITIGEMAAAPAKVIRLGWETAGKGWGDIYGQYEEMAEFVEKKTGKEIPFPKWTPEQFGRGVSTVGKIGTYLTPVGLPYLASEIAGGVEAYKHPEKEAEKAFKDYYKEYIKNYEEAEKDLEEGYELEPKLTEAELKVEVLPEIISQLRKEQAAAIGTGVLILGGAAAWKVGSKVYRWGKTEIVRKVPTRALEKGRRIIEQKSIIKGGKELKFQKATAWGEKRPPLLEYKTTKAREFFRMKPKKIVREIPAIKYKDISYSPITGKRWVTSEGSSFSVRFETGKKYATFYKVGGTSAPVDLKSFYKLSKTQRYEWKKLAEEIAGHPVPESQVVNILKKGSQKYGGEEVIQRLFRLKKGTGKDVLVTTPWKEGTSVIQVESAIEVLPAGEKAGRVFFKFRAVGKPVTKPFARATGKVDYVTGRIIQHEPIIISPEKGYGISPADIKKTSLADTLAVQKVKIVTKFKLPPKPTSSKIPSPKVIPPVPKPTPEVYPLMVGGTGLETSVFAGTGTYEVTETVSMAPKVFSIDTLPSKIEIVPTEVYAPQETLRIDITPKVEIVSKPKDILTQGITPLFKYKPEVIQFQPLDLQMREEQISLISPLTMTEQLPLTRQVPLTGQLSLLKQVPVQTQVQTQVQVPVQTQVQPQVPVQPTPQPPRGGFGWLRGRPQVPTKRPTPKQKLKQGYTFEVRRKGKWHRAKIPFAFETKIGAEARAQEVVLNEAAASYRIVKAKRGKQVVKSRRKVSPYRDVLFRPGKEKGVKVQKKLLRILTSGEKKEISYAGGIARMKQARSPGFVSKKRASRKPTIRKSITRKSTIRKPIIRKLITKKSMKETSTKKTIKKRKRGAKMKW